MPGPGRRVCPVRSWRMVVDDDDRDISRQVREHGWYVDEAFEASVFEAQLRPGMTALDLGANVGFYTLLARGVVGETGRVAAFEPFPRSAELIEASVAENGYTNVAVVRAAAAERDGRATLHLSPNFASEHSLLDIPHGAAPPEGPTLEVDVVTVDTALERAWGSRRVDFVKMDVEGSEWRVLEGMRGVLAESPRLTLMTEFWPYGFRAAGTTPEAYLRALDELGFRLRHIDVERREVYPVTVDEMVDLTRRNEARPHDYNPVMDGWAWGWYTNLLCTREG